MQGLRCHYRGLQEAYGIWNVPTGRDSEQRDTQGDGGSRGARDNRRCRPPGRRLEIDCFARSRRKLARRGDDPRARLRRNDRAWLHLSSRRGDLARRQVRRHRHGHQRPVEPLLCRARDRHRAGVPGRRLYPLSRQHRGKRGSPAAGDPLDARARGGGACARARDGHVGERAEAPSCRVARRPGDAPPSGPQGVPRRAGKQGRRAKSDRPSHRRRTQPRRLCRRHLVDAGPGGEARGLPTRPGRSRNFARPVARHRNNAPITRAAARRFRNCSTSPTLRPPRFASTTLSRSASPAR